MTVAAECRLSGAGDEVEKRIRNELTIANPKYRDAKKYGRWIGKKLKPTLEFYRTVKDGIGFPRGYTNQAVLLCRRLAGGDPIIEDKRLRLPEVAIHFRGELRPYQKRALADATRRDFGVIEADTGSGKTVIGLAVIAARRQPALILVHTRELLYQWADQIDRFLGLEAGMVGDGKFNLAPVTVAIVNSARKRIDELKRVFGLICVDECHRVPSSMFTEVVKNFPGRYSLGLSATAFRRDGLTELINIYLGDTVHQVDQEELEKSGAVLRPEYIQRPTEFRFFYRDNYQEMLSKLTKNHERNRLIAADIAAEAKREPGTLLVVSDRVEHCENLAWLTGEADPSLRVRILTGRMKAEERNQVIEEVRGGQIEVLVATLQLIGEGFDCPGLRALFLTTPIRFSGRLLQVVGRILRPSEGKNPKVFDYVDRVGVLEASARSRSRLFMDFRDQATLPLAE